MHQNPGSFSYRWTRGFSHSAKTVTTEFPESAWLDLASNQAHINFSLMSWLKTEEYNYYGYNLKLHHNFGQAFNLIRPRKTFLS